MRYSPTMRTPFWRWLYLALTLGGWYLGRELSPLLQRAIGWEQLVTSREWQTLLGHWFVWQGPQVLVMLGLWVVGVRLELMPTVRAAFGSGGSWRRVLSSGLLATAVLLVVTVGIGAAMGGRFGWYRNPAKVAGDLVSNLYEELVHRCVLFCAFYGAAAGLTFPLTQEAPVSRLGVAVAGVGSSIMFAAGHAQYPLGLRVFMAVLSLAAWVWPWVRARSVWAPWISHTLGDVVGDTILKL